MKVELIRHGDTPWMAEKKYQGRSDIPLSEAGIRKLEKADHVPPFVYVSGMKRSVQTASAIFPDAKQICVPALAEMDFGVFEGRSADEMENDPAYREWVDGFCMGQCPGGESKDGFCERVCRSFADLLDRHILSGEEADCIIVAHGGTAMAVMERFSDTKRLFHEWYLKSGCGYILDADRWMNERTLHFLSGSDHNRTL